MTTTGSQAARETGQPQPSERLAKPAELAELPEPPEPPERSAGFHRYLAAPGRSLEIPESEDLYGWLVGDWDLDVKVYWVDVSGRGLKGEVHAGWVLEGRAVQDVWIMPRVAERSGAGAPTGPPQPNLNMYGTTLRVWDAALKAWRITWIDPVTGQRNDQIGRRIGQDIVQIGALPDGTPARWRFTEITPDSFHWTGDVLLPDGETWDVKGEFLATRIR